MEYGMNAYALQTQIQLVKNSTSQLYSAKEQLRTYRNEICTIYQSAEQAYLLTAIDQSIAAIQKMIDHSLTLQEQFHSMERFSTSYKGRW